MLRRPSDSLGAPPPPGLSFSLGHHHLPRRLGHSSVGGARAPPKTTLVRLARLPLWFSLPCIPPFPLPFDPLGSEWPYGLRIFGREGTPIGKRMPVSGGQHDSRMVELLLLRAAPGCSFMRTALKPPHRGGAYLAALAVVNFLTLFVIPRNAAINTAARTSFLTRLGCFG